MLKNYFIATAAATIIGGCATTAPKGLIDARNQYAVSSAGPASKLTPSDLYDAKKSLDQANQEFTEHGDTDKCRDYSYIATRKFALADAKARTEADRLKIASAVKAGVVVRDKQVKQSQDALASTREQLKDEQRTTDSQGKDLQKATFALEAEKEARQAAENKLAGAMSDLATIAAVKQEARGVVITLSGGVLFVSGKYALLNTAMTKLDQVAEALKQQDGDKTMIVEGHTDSQGSDAINQPLSLNRAGAVRDYLVSRGVAAEKISAVGFGSSRPIADNKTAENRANNRRVEIVIGPSKISGL